LQEQVIKVIEDIKVTKGIREQLEHKALLGLKVLLEHKVSLE